VKSVLREKDLRILNVIVENYLKIGGPTSSNFIVKKVDFPVSPATVRNIMVKLEEMGYLYQPHTSAGRIPTDRGLRFYVNSLFEEAFFSPDSIDLPESGFFYEKGNFNSLLIQASKLLSDHSDNMGFVVSPKIMDINFRHLRFIKIAEEKILLILVTSFNLVLTEVVETKSYFTQDELDRASRYINENFSGKSLLFVRDFLMKEMPKYKLRVENLLHKLMQLLKTYFSTEGIEKQIFLQGTSKLLEKPELFDMGKLQNLFHNFEEKAKLAKLLSDFISLNRVKVVIGSEMALPEISDCSLILSHYGYDRQILGSLGIIGPKRIPYKKIIPLVDSVAKKLSQTISFDR
jgi:heat-inducible transcriptional repressor